MRNRSAHDEHVTEVTQRRLQALMRELGEGEPDAADAGGLTGLPDPPSEGAAPFAPVVAARDQNDATGGRHALPRRRLSLSRRCGRWLQERLPGSLTHGPPLTPAHLGIVALVVAGGLALATWTAVRAGDPGADRSTAASTATPPQVEVSPSPSEAAGVGTGIPAPGSGTVGNAVPRRMAEVDPTAGTETAELVVDVIGKVRRPGIAVLPLGSRVVDAVKAAGGARRGADLTTINLARPLVDGEQLAVGIRVPRVPGVAASSLGSGAPGAPTPGPGQLVNLNTADQPTLETLPGIGPVTAAAILQWRAEHGGFTSVDELLEVSGIGEATLADLAPLVTI